MGWDERKKEETTNGEESSGENGRHNSWASWAFPSCPLPSPRDSGWPANLISTARPGCSPYGTVPAGQCHGWAELTGIRVCTLGRGSRERRVGAGGRASRTALPLIQVSKSTQDVPGMAKNGCVWVCVCVCMGMGVYGYGRVSHPPPPLRPRHPVTMFIHGLPRLSLRPAAMRPLQPHAAKVGSDGFLFLGLLDRGRTTRPQPQEVRCANLTREGMVAPDGKFLAAKSPRPRPLPDEPLPAKNERGSAWRGDAGTALSPIIASLPVLGSLRGRAPARWHVWS